MIETLPRISQIDTDSFDELRTGNTDLKTHRDCLAVAGTAGLTPENCTSFRGSSQIEEKYPEVEHKLSQLGSRLASGCILESVLDTPEKLWSTAPEGSFAHSLNKVATYLEINRANLPRLTRLTNSPQKKNLKILSVLLYHSLWNKQFLKRPNRKIVCHTGNEI